MKNKNLCRYCGQEMPAGTVGNLARGLEEMRVIITDSTIRELGGLVRDLAEHVQLMNGIVGALVTDDNSIININEEHIGRILRQSHLVVTNSLTVARAAEEWSNNE